MNKIEIKQLEDSERAIILAYSALINNNFELAKKILEEQIEKTYDNTQPD